MLRQLVGTQILTLGLRPQLIQQNVKLASRSAAFWRIGTNLQVFKRMLKESGDSEWKYRLLLFLGLFIVLNFLFNIMMAVLTNIYLQRLQPSTVRFGLLVNSEYKQGIVEEMIKMNDMKANEKYLNCLRMLARDNGMDNEDVNVKPDDGESNNSGLHDICNIIMGEEQLDKWYYEKRDPNYISKYCDLILRYAMTLSDDKSQVAYESIDKCFQIVNRYEKLSHKSMGSYSLKNKALRTKADIMKSRGENFKVVESCMLDSIRLVEENEFKNDYPPDRDVGIVPEGEISSNNLANSLLDLCSLYTDTREPKYMSKALSILISELRSLEEEYHALDKRYDSGALYRKKKVIRSGDEKRLMELGFEKIPLIQMEISEILWYSKHYEKAIEMAKNSAQKSSMYSHGNYNSAKIAKIGFNNLSKMYHRMGDEEVAELCQLQSEAIEVPLNAFITPSSTVRNAVLEYWFGSWGNFLFPG
ncbi:hypothetical protein FOA43_004717 [Brettanomyces nanus]|uniref:Uncharacterized protein n=1 Tax=Eeniella nana TaxID=13502 RepID=A0A875SD12_EENNA|nr:uncharacterized protein FOA43_004717 [Brettanomyces nanus]QPG77309.1 hypothetical protein FOA43_004717 [Brettanomyces nanus]